MEVYTGEWPIYKFITVPTLEFLLTVKRQDLCFRVKTDLTCCMCCICWVSSPLSRCGLHSWRRHCGSDSTTKEETRRDRHKHNFTRIKKPINVGVLWENSSPFGPAHNFPPLFKGSCILYVRANPLQSEGQKSQGTQCPEGSSASPYAWDATLLLAQSTSTRHLAAIGLYFHQYQIHTSVKM